MVKIFCNIGEPPYIGFGWVRDFDGDEMEWARSECEAKVFTKEESDAVVCNIRKNYNGKRYVYLHTHLVEV